MFRGVEMLGGVLVFGGVAAANVAASEAETQVDPGIAHFEALFAAFGFWFYIFDLIEMGADAGHMLLLGSSPRCLNRYANLKAGITWC